MILQHKVALVTGGSQGIGKAIAEKLASAGATIAIAALENEALIKTAAQFEESGSPFKTYGVDLRDAAQVDSLIPAIVRDLGPIDILINNAGVTGPTAPVHQIAIEEWDHVLQINLRTPFLLSRVIAPSMIDRKAGHIINISSIAGKMAYPLRTPYASSKWGIVGLTLALAQELGPYNIHVNAICPGPTRSEMIDAVIRARAEATGVSFDAMSQRYTQAAALKRMVVPEEIAELALFLCSPQSAGITGQAIDISAGYGFRIG